MALLALALCTAGCERQQDAAKRRSGSDAPSSLSPAATRVTRVGLERLAEGEDEVLRGKRIGLIVHAASVTLDGRHAIDVFEDLGLDVVRLFSPEHGLSGRAAAGEAVESGLDPASGLEVISLHGSDRRPPPDKLADLDILVFDLQGAGVRFYTYVSTMIYCLEAAGESGLEFVVLDRPNPLGGERIEGPVSAPRAAVPESIVNVAPGPLVHGLTMGEMARYVSTGMRSPPLLHVVPMAGWERSMVWADTGRPWVAPSPNLRSAEAAMAYPGTALLETTNVSEGRGTSDPFLVLGAPWLDPTAIDLSLPGVVLRPIAFTPTASPAAPAPEYVDEECAGWRVEITDTAAVEPYRLGVALTRDLMRQPGFEWRRGGEALTWLLGTDRVLADLLAGKTVDEIVAVDAADHERWRQQRLAYLLY